MTSPKRILHVLGGMDRGGAETMVMNIYRHMDREQIQFDFAVQTQRECHYDSEIEALGARIFHLPVPAEAGMLAYAASLARALKSHGPFAAVHSHVHLFSGVILQVSKRLGIPVRISHSHSAGEESRPSWSRRAYRQTMKCLIRASATHLLGCSRQACERLFGAGCWSDDRVQTVPNAVCLADFLAATRPGYLRNELHLPAGTPLIGHIGSFTEPKNHAFSIGVFQQLTRLLPDAHFVLAGDGDLRPQIESAIRAAGLGHCVHMLGIRSDIPRIMSALDLLLMPSLWEGLPLVLVEAQAAGLPCLVSDSITPEADLGIGLLAFANLGSGADEWAAKSMVQLHRAVPSRQVREDALRSAGYEAGTVARRLAGIYSGQEFAWTS